MKINQTIVIFTNGSTPTETQKHLALRLAMFNVVFANLRYVVEGEFLDKAVAVAGDVPDEYKHLPDAEIYAKEYLQKAHNLSLTVGGKAPKNNQNKNQNQNNNKQNKNDETKTDDNGDSTNSGEGDDKGDDSDDSDDTPKDNFGFA